MNRLAGDSPRYSVEQGCASPTETRTGRGSRPDPSCAPSMSTDAFEEFARGGQTWKEDVATTIGKSRGQATRTLRKVLAQPRLIDH